jgi:hypothetical protein
MREKADVGFILNSKNAVAWGPHVGLLSLRTRAHTSGAIFHAASMLTAPTTRRTAAPPYPVVGSHATTLSHTRSRRLQLPTTSLAIFSYRWWARLQRRQPSSNAEPELHACPRSQSTAAAPPFSLQSPVAEAKRQRHPGSTLHALPLQRFWCRTSRNAALSASHAAVTGWPFPRRVTYPTSHRSSPRRPSSCRRRSSTALPCWAKSLPPRLRRQPRRRVKHIASLPPVTALASPPQVAANGATFRSLL